jgi:hypothetical protein
MLTAAPPTSAHSLATGLGMAMKNALLMRH